MNYEKISPKTVKTIYSAYASLSESPLDPQIRALVELRTSQVNGCTYCCEVHSKDARKAGLSDVKLDALPSWETTSHFDEKEKHALAYCESVTLNSTNASSIRDTLKTYFNEREIVDLTLTISVMNALNRIAINLRDE